MNDCENIIVKDSTSWHGDVFDHPSYEHICKLTGKQVIPYIHCKPKRCKNYKTSNDTRNEKILSL